jgi:hypothetical protein
MPVTRSGLPPSFVLSAAAWIPRSVSEATCSVEHRHASDISRSTPGPSLRSGLCCPGPSTLNRPHPPHSQAHHNFVVRRLICDAFAVRERLGDPRVVPRFTCSILPGMSSSTSPGSRSLHVSSSFTRRACLRRLSYGSALPTLADFGAYGFTFVTTYQVARLPTGDFYSRAFNGLVTLPVVGYDYGGNWTISTGGTFTRRTGS